MLAECQPQINQPSDSPIFDILLLLLFFLSPLLLIFLIHLTVPSLTFSSSSFSSSFFFFFFSSLFSSLSSSFFYSSFSLSFSFTSYSSSLFFSFSFYAPIFHLTTTPWPSPSTTFSPKQQLHQKEKLCQSSCTFITILLPRCFFYIVFMIFSLSFCL